MNIKHALDLLGQSETAIAVFTRNQQLQFNIDDTGTSGNWKINPNQRPPDKVLIYNRRRASSNQGEIFMAHFVGYSPSPENGRQLIHFRHWRLVGTTDQNWQEFADTGTSPVRYLHK